MKKNFISIILIVFCVSSFAQKNVVKLNPLSVYYFKSVPLYYERILSNSISASMGFSYRMPLNVGGKLGSVLSDGLSSSSGSSKITPLRGFAITPEIKFYTGKKNAPRGFYIAPYFRYSNYKLGAEVDFTAETGKNFNFDMDMKFKNIGGGVQLGVQWLIKDAVAIDWFFAGPRYESKSIEIDVSSSDTGINWNELATEYEDDVNEAISGIPFLGTITATSSSNGFNAKLPYWMINWRFGLSIGYAF